MAVVRCGPVIGVGMVLLAAACRGSVVPEQREASRTPGRASLTPAPHVVPSSDCSEPTVVRRVLPEYPLYHMHLEGAYGFRVSVTADGHTEAVQVIRAANPGWAASAGADAVRKWTWKPAICNGVPSRAETTVSIQVSTKR